MFKVFGKRLVKIEPQYDIEGKLITDGKPETISLGEWKNKNVAELFVENVRKNTDEKTWKIYIKSK